MAVITCRSTHGEKTRFWITLEQGVEFVHKNLCAHEGGRVVRAKDPVDRITELAPPWRTAGAEISHPPR
jgi:FlaA1/EpsC-like NDP-sugar epimerase